MNNRYISSIAPSFSKGYEITTVHNNTLELDISTKRHDAIDSILNEGLLSMNVINGDIANPENPF